MRMLETIFLDLSFDDIVFLRELQLCHDVAADSSRSCCEHPFLESFRYCCERLARKYNLTLPQERSQ